NIPASGIAPINFWDLNGTGGLDVSPAIGNANTDFPAPGDYDGDGRDDFALYRAGVAAAPQGAYWVLLTSTFTMQYYAWGTTGDLQCARDFDGDGITDPNVFRRGPVGSTAVWYTRLSTIGAARLINLGTSSATTND